jgi:hypothetical protein
LRQKLIWLIVFGSSVIVLEVPNPVHSHHGIQASTYL